MIELRLDMWSSFRSGACAVFLVAAVVLACGAVEAQEEEFETIDSSVCADCHEQSLHGTTHSDDLAHSVHEGLDCLACHVDKDTVPHRPPDEKFHVGCKGCRNCHEQAAMDYKAHGRSEIGKCEDMPHCSDCHGDHDILPSSVKRSRTHPVELPATCGKCHENLEITTKYDILIDHPIGIYLGSVHGKATRGGVYVAASCDDCHSTNGTAHRILSPGSPDSSINHFNIPKTCGKCHKGIENDFWEGIHGKLVARGETDAPVCTDCHGEHGILSPDDPTVAGFAIQGGRDDLLALPRVGGAQREVRSLKAERLTTFIDSYHGLKSKAGDTHVANCASCHGVHRILPSSDPTSTVNPANLQVTCGECHPAISEKMASTPIHGIGGQGLRTPGRGCIVEERIYIIAIVVIIGLMVLHWLIDLAAPPAATCWPERPQVHADAARRGGAARAAGSSQLHLAGDLRLRPALRPGLRLPGSSSDGRAASRSGVRSTASGRSCSCSPWSGTAIFLTTSRAAAAILARHDADSSKDFCTSSCGGSSTTSGRGRPDESRASSVSTTWRRRSTGR